MAEELKLKGLAHNYEFNHHGSLARKANMTDFETPHKTEFEDITEEKLLDSDQLAILENDIEVEELLTNENMTINTLGKDDSYDHNNYSQFDQMIEGYSGAWKCKVCGKMSSQNSKKWVRKVDMFCDPA